jgi:hypothetical protein
MFFNINCIVCYADFTGFSKSSEKIKNYLGKIYILLLLCYIMNYLIALFEGIRIFKRSLRVKKKGVRRYKGSVKQICEQIIDDCWNGKYYQVSNGHFCEFYMRDFGWCIDSLLKLGYKKRVDLTLSHVLNVYSKDKLTTTITPRGKCVDLFCYSPDSLAYLLRSLRVAKVSGLVSKYKLFLEKEILRCFNYCFDKDKSLVKSNLHLGSMKDESKRKSSTYDNVMLVVISREADLLKLKNPFFGYDIKSAIKKHLWNGKYFYDDLTKHHAVTGDSNIMPFFMEIFNDKKMLKSCIKEIQRVGLDKPFPLKYSSRKYKEHKMHFVSFFAGEYEHDSIWMHMGPLYVNLVKKIDKKLANKYIDSYTKLIKKHSNFLEVYNSDGSVFKNMFYYTDESMLWVVNYLNCL